MSTDRSQQDELVPLIDLPDATGSILRSTQATLEEIENASGIKRVDLGRKGDLLRKVISHTVAYNYELAAREINDFIESRHKFPEYIARVERYRNDAEDLILSIKAKRDMGKQVKLSNSKSQELRERIFFSFRELRRVLQKMEHLDREVRINDVRSTTLVVKVGFLGVFAIFCTVFTVEFFAGPVYSLDYVAQDVIDRTVNFIFDLF